MKLFISVCALLFSVGAFAAYPRPRDIANELNNSSVGARVRLGTQLEDKTVHVLRGLYDFNIQGGAVYVNGPPITLLDIDGKPAVLPPGAIVKNCALLVDEILASGGSAKVSFSTGLLVEDVKPATAYTTFGTKDTVVGCQISGGTPTTWVKLPGNYTAEYLAPYSSSYTPTMKITGAALTRGKIRVLLEYILSR